MKNYRGIELWTGDCPNGCFHKLIDRAIEENSIAGIEPKVAEVPGFGMVGFEIRRYSAKLKRHTETVNGHYAYAHWTHCPICGERLEKHNA